MSALDTYHRVIGGPDEVGNLDYALEYDGNTDNNHWQRVNLYEKTPSPFIGVLHGESLTDAAGNPDRS